jgi:predicted SAM-dependent methyltransferase
MIKLNLGCGDVQPEGWINVDYSLGARLSKIPLYNSINRVVKLFDIGSDGSPRLWDSKVFIWNLIKPFPWKDGSVTYIYSSHTLEHFSRQDGFTFLRECHRVMKQGGIIRIVIPDLKSVIVDYMDGKVRADNFVETLGVLYETKKNTLKNLLVPLTQFPHRCMYDKETLLTVLTSIGFQAESKKPFFSDISDIKIIELASRTERAVIVEGRKL